MRQGFVQPITQLIALLIIMVAGASNLHAQPRTSIDPPEPRVYDSVRFSIQHNGSLETATDEPPPASANLRATSSVQRQSSISSVAGRTEIITWQYDALEPGDFRIGPVTVVADRRRVTLPEVTGTIRPAVVEGTRLPAEVEQFAGNPNPLSSGDRALARYLTGKAFVVIDAPSDIVVGWPVQLNTYVFISTTITGAEERSFAPSNASGQQFVTIPELSTPHRTIGQERVRFGNEEFRRYHVHTTTMVPTRAGRAEIRSGELRTDFLTFSRTSSRLLTSIMFEPSRREVQIRPLPAPLEGSHIQVVGNHSVTSSVDRERLNEGELVTLTIRISGNGYLELASLERMPDIDGLIFIREEVASRINTTLRGEYVADKTFRRTYQASHPGTIVIPPITMANYNPRTNEQEMRRSEEIRLTVAPVQGSAQALGAGPMQRPVQADAREIGTGGILHIDTAPLNLGSGGSARWESVFLQTWYWVVHGLVLLGTVAFVSVLMVRRLSAHDPAASQAAARKSRVVTALKRAEHASSGESADAFYSALLAGLMSQMGRTLQREPGALIAEQAVSELKHRGLQEGVADELESLVERCQNVHYMPSAPISTRDEDLNRARRLVRELEKFRK